MSHKPKQVRYISSFLLALIPVLLMGGFFYLYYLNNARYYIRNDRLASFEKSVSQMNHLFAYQERIAAYMDEQSDLLYTLEDGSIVPSNESQILSELAHLEKMLPVSAKILLYFRGQKELYSSEECTSISDFELSYSPSTDFVMSRFFTHLIALKSPFTYRLTPSSGTAESGNTIAYIFTLPSLSNSPVVDAIFLTNETAFQEIVSNIMGNDSINYYVYSSSYNVLVQNDAAIPGIDLNEIFRAKGSGILEKSIGGQRFVLMRSVSEDMLLTHVAVMMERDFYEELYRNGRILSTLILILTAICFFLVIWVAYRRYQPIGKLFRNIVGNEALPKGVSEFDAIEQIHQQSLLQNERMSLQLQAQNKIVASHFVLRLITGKFQDLESLEHSAALSHLSLDGNCRAAFRILFPDMSAQLAYLERFSEIQAPFSIRGIHVFTAELMDESGCGCIWSFHSPPDSSAALLRTLASEFREAVLQIIDPQGNPSIGIGTIYSELTDLKQSYYEASTALQFSAADPFGGSASPFHFYSDALGTPDAASLSIPHIEVRLLTEGIQHGDTEVAASALSAIFDRLSGTTGSILVLRLVCNDVIKALLNLAEQRKLSIEESTFQRLIHFSTLKEFQDAAALLVEKMCIQISERLAHHNTRQRDEVLSYIIGKYVDPMFSLEVASEELKITRGKLNLILKEETGTSFWQYVSLLRLDEVKRQLVQTDTPIQDIVRSAGYQDVSNFLRKFRETEGITAKQYRAQARTRQERG